MSKALSPPQGLPAGMALKRGDEVHFDFAGLVEIDISLETNFFGGAAALSKEEWLEKLSLSLQEQ